MRKPSQTRGYRVLCCMALCSVELSVIDTLIAGDNERIVPPPQLIAVPEFSQVAHPRLFVDEQRLTEVRELIASGTSPFVDAWSSLKKSADRLAIEKRKPRPYTGRDSFQFYAACLGKGKRHPGDGQRVRDLALAYAISQDEKYAARAIGYLTAWSTAIPTPGSKFNGSSHSQNPVPAIGMLPARGIVPFCYAYDLLYQEIDVETRSSIESWLRVVSNQIIEGIHVWHRNGYFNAQDYQNHSVAHTMGLAVIGYTIGDRRMVQLALDHRWNPRNFRVLISGTILMKGDPPHHRELKYGRHRVHTGEIYDRYRHFMAEGANKGLQYSYLSLNLLTLTAEAAWRNGLDLYSFEADSGETLRLPFEFYSDFYRLKDASIHGGFYSGEDSRIGKAGDSTGLFELGVLRFPKSRSPRRVLKSVDRADFDHLTELLGWVVLTHGVSDP